MIDIFIVSELEVSNWRKEISYGKDSDPKSYGSVSYVDCSRAVRDFTVAVTRLSVSPEDSISQVIGKAVGQEPRRYSEAELEEALQEVDLKGVKNEVFKLARTWLPHRWDIYLLQRRFDIGSHAWSHLPSDNKISDCEQLNNQVLQIQRVPLSDIVNDARAEVWRRRSQMQASMRSFRRGSDFLAALRLIGEDGGLEERRKQTSGFRARTKQSVSRRPLLALLYTDEDIHVASYVRTHLDELDRASGDLCDLGVIENPLNSRAHSFWRRIIGDENYVAWNLLGWAESRPYELGDVYELAKRLGVPFKDIPCIVEFTGDLSTPNRIFRLGEDLTSDFRHVFTLFQKRSPTWSRRIRAFRRSTEAGGLSKSLTSDNQELLPRNQLCFLSHSSADKYVVRTVATLLHSLGIETWFDEWEILPGDRITKRIEEGLSKAEVIVVFLSAAAADSRWVEEESHNALYQAVSGSGYRILPVLLEPCQVPLLLQNYRRIEVGSDPNKIAHEVRRAVERSSRKPPVEGHTGA
ncbi:MAG: toll/interleukin-1 receptor domain-containing protein [Acidobacteriota bacterium]